MLFFFGRVVWFSNFLSDFLVSYFLLNFRFFCLSSRAKDTNFSKTNRASAVAAISNADNPLETNLHVVGILNTYFFNTSLKVTQVPIAGYRAPRDRSSERDQYQATGQFPVES